MGQPKRLVLDYKDRLNDPFEVATHDGAIPAMPASIRSRLLSEAASPVGAASFGVMRMLSAGHAGKDLAVKRDTLTRILFPNQKFNR